MQLSKPLMLQKPYDVGLQWGNVRLHLTLAAEVAQQPLDLSLSLELGT